jgi:Flp pilus assembly protein TadD
MRLVYAVFILLLTLIALRRSVMAYNEAIKLDTNDSETWQNKGIALNASGRNAGAEAAFARARELGGN